MTKTKEDIDRIAGPLYDGGWRSVDAMELAEEYGFNSEEAEAVCQMLEQLEKEGENENEA